MLLVVPLYTQEIAFVGNSITASGYNTVVDSLLTEYNTYNFGVPGITVAIDGFNYKNTQEYKDVLDLKPQVIVMLLGGNDWNAIASHPKTWTNYWQNEYKFLVTNFMKNSTVFLGTIPYRIYESDSIKPINEMNEIIKLIANKMGLTVIDFNSAMGFTVEYFNADGIHPNNAGKYILAYAAYDVLKDYLGILSIKSDNIYNNKLFSKNFPNPFNSNTEIKYMLPLETQVTITVFDLMGNEVKTLINDYQSQGIHFVTWDGTNSFGKDVISGIYFYRLQAGSFNNTDKMVILK